MSFGAIQLSFIMTYVPPNNAAAAAWIMLNRSLLRIMGVIGLSVSLFMHARVRVTVLTRFVWRLLLALTYMICEGQRFV